MTAPLRVLMVEDSPTDAKLLIRELGRLGRPLDVERVDEPASTRAALERERWDLVLSDWSMPAFSGMGALEMVKSMGFDVPFIIVSGTVGEDVAVEAMRAGAHDYVLKDRLSRLVPAVERELREHLVRQEQSRANRALLASEARYRRIVETTNEGVWQIDSDGRTSFMNARMAQMLGCDPADVLGRSPAEFLGEEDRVKLAENLQRARAGVAEQSSVRFARRDGTHLWALIEASPIVDAAGQYDGSVALVMDVTERREAEMALEVSEARFKRLWDSGIILLALFDPTGLILDVNDAGAGILGYTRAELLAASPRWRDLTPAEWAQHDERADEQLAANGAAAPWEKELIRKDGTRVPVLAAAAQLSGSERIAIALDLSERKAAAVANATLEAQLRQAQKMEAVGRLAGGIAHDFNNVLSDLELW